jgi:hypothetical protein
MRKQKTFGHQRGQERSSLRDILREANSGGQNARGGFFIADNQ